MDVGSDTRAGGDIMESRKTVMVVDDQDAIVDLIKRMLTLEGYEVIDGCSGEAALYLNERYPFPIHLLVSDVRMAPGMSGCDLARAMRSLRPDIKILYLSAFPGDSRVELEVNAGMAAFMHKPFNYRDLTATVERLLTGSTEASGPENAIGRRA
jgi:two-component system cell cycle sensor histidine kinase/response regulator CckA